MVFRLARLHTAALLLSLLSLHDGMAQNNPDFVPPPVPMWFHGISFQFPLLIGEVQDVSTFQSPPLATPFEYQSGHSLGIQSKVLFWPERNFHASLGIYYGSISMLSTEETVVQGGQTGTIHRDLLQSLATVEAYLGYDIESFVIDNQYGLLSAFVGSSVVVANNYTIEQRLVSPVFAELGTESTGSADHLATFSPFVGLETSMFVRRLFPFPLRIGIETRFWPVPLYSGSTMRSVSLGMNVSAHFRTEPERVVDTVYLRDTTSRYTKLLDTIAYQLIEQQVHIDSALDEGVNVHYIRHTVQESWLKLVPKPKPLLATELSVALRSKTEVHTDSLHIQLKQVANTVAIPLQTKVFFHEFERQQPVTYSNYGARATHEQTLLIHMHDSLQAWVSEHEQQRIGLTSVNPDAGTVRQRRDAAVERANAVAALLLSEKQTHTTRVESSMQYSQLLTYTATDNRHVALRTPKPERHIVVVDTNVRSFGATLVLSPIVFSDAGIEKWEIVVEDERDSITLALVYGSNDLPTQLEIDVDQLPWIHSFEPGRLRLYTRVTDKEQQVVQSEPQFVRFTPEENTSSQGIATGSSMIAVYVPLENSAASHSSIHSFVREILEDNPSASASIEAYALRLKTGTRKRELYAHIIQHAPYLREFVSEDQVAIKERPTTFDTEHAMGRELASCYVIRITID